VSTVGVPPERGGRQRNEDNYLVCRAGDIRYLDGDQEVQTTSDGSGILLVVCDGMGGHEHGHLASRTAVRVMAKLHQRHIPRDPEGALITYIAQSHDQLHKRMLQQGPVTMGTTLTACWCQHRKAYWAQVGDSHLFLVRGGSIRRLTRAQTRNEFATRDGGPTSPDGHHLCQNFIYGSRGFADNRRLRLDPGVDSGTEALQTGDYLVLATDGLWGALSEASIVRILEAASGPQRAAEAMVERAMEGGSVDNITVIITRVGDLSPTQGWAEDDIETLRDP